MFTNDLLTLGRSGCSISTQQYTCLVIQGLLPQIKTVACDIATKDKTKQHDCGAGFDATAKAAKSICTITLAHVCDKNLCPQNLGHDACDGLQN